MTKIHMKFGDLASVAMFTCCIVHLFFLFFAWSKIDCGEEGNCRFRRDFSTVQCVSRRSKSVGFSRLERIMNRMFHLVILLL